MCRKEILKPVNISVISLEEYQKIYDDNACGLNWDCLFVLPFWMKNWWQVFGENKTRTILAVRSPSCLLGIAPLMLEGHTAKFLGSESVCDYQDIIVSDECPDLFFSIILNYLREMGVHHIELGALRPDSKALSGFSKIAKKMGCPEICKPVDRFYQMELPETWEGYLNILDRKQRHEVRRKLRRLYAAGNIEYHVVNNLDIMAAAFEEFLSLFQASRKDKSQFLTDRMKCFFRSLAKTMAERKMLQLGFLDVDGKTVASTFCFEYSGTVYLYNNGYHPEFRGLSVGSLGKIFSIKHSIEKKMVCYNFLKGDEAYKERLGGRPLTLYRLSIDLKP